MDRIADNYHFGLALWFGVGLCLGSFVNVLIHRLPKDESVVRPRSHCPSCRSLIAWYDNVPLLSFLVLRGRCRSCGLTIPLRYPFVEFILGISGAALWWRYPGQWLWVWLALGAVAALTAITFIDFDEFIIPNELSLGMLAVGILTAPVNPFFSGGAAGRLAASALSAAGGFFLCWGVAAFGKLVFRRDAMGMGDVKLLAAIGAWTGALGAFDSLVTASMIGALYGLALIASGKVKRQDPIPFGPFLSLGAVLNFFYLLPFGFPFHNL